MNTRIDKSKLLIGTYCLQPNAQTEEHIKDIAECGIDLITCLYTRKRKLLDALEHYHIGCIFTGAVPGWWGGGSEDKVMSEINPLSAYDESIVKFKDHPAIWGIDIGDEPSSLDYEHYANIINHIKEKFPKQMLYLNLYPYYAYVPENTDEKTKSQLGTFSYADYIDQYIEKIPLPYISYDFYVYACKNIGWMFENYRIVAEACRKTGREFWYIPQVNSKVKDIFMSENMLRYQAYTALAYGATVINWACWTKGWWHNNVLDDDGKKTEQYEKLKKINFELKNIGEVYMKYRNVNTHLLGFENEPTFGKFPELVSKKTVNTGFVRDLHAGKNDRLVVGEMVSRSGLGETALVICNATDYLDENHTTARVTFRADDCEVKLFSGEGYPVLRKSDKGVYSFDLENTHGVIVTIK